VLPERWQVEMVGGYLLDFEAAKSFVESSPFASGSARGPCR
jgi:hypothetical protein